MEWLEWTFRFFFPVHVSSQMCYCNESLYPAVCLHCRGQQRAKHPQQSWRFQFPFGNAVSSMLAFFYSVCCDQILCSTNLRTAGRVNGDVTSVRCWVSPAALHWNGSLTQLLPVQLLQKFWTVAHKNSNNHRFRHFSAGNSCSNI